MRVPVTADIEAGYANDAGGFERTAHAVLEAGAVEINIEDGAFRPSELVERIGAARRTVDRAGLPMFINARTDVYLAGLVAPEQLFSETLARANRYIEAGADGVFVPGVTDVEVIRALAEATGGPLNVMAGPGSPNIAQLAGLGVARVSLGSGVAQAAYETARRAADDRHLRVPGAVRRPQRTELPVLTNRLRRT